MRGSSSGRASEQTATMKHQPTSSSSSSSSSSCVPCFSSCLSVMWRCSERRRWQRSQLRFHFPQRRTDARRRSRCSWRWRPQARRRRPTDQRNAEESEPRREEEGELTIDKSGGTDPSALKFNTVQSRDARRRLEKSQSFKDGERASCQADNLDAVLPASPLMLRRRWRRRVSALSGTSVVGRRGRAGADDGSGK